MIRPPDLEGTGGNQLIGPVQVLLVGFWSIDQGIRADGGNPAKPSALHSRSRLFSTELLTACLFVAIVVVAVNERVELVFVRIMASP